MPRALCSFPVENDSQANGIGEIALREVEPGHGQGTVAIVVNATPCVSGTIFALEKAAINSRHSCVATHADDIAVGLAFVFPKATAQDLRRVAIVTYRTAITWQDGILRVASDACCGCPIKIVCSRNIDRASILRIGSLKKAANDIETAPRRITNSRAFVCIDIALT
jgi:hypothetical protein